MANAELLKVIAGLECCTAEGEGCTMCPYDDGWGIGIKCCEDLMHDALEILREVAEDGLY